jgi:hypothetical protein
MHLRQRGQGKLRNTINKYMAISAYLVDGSAHMDGNKIRKRRIEDPSLRFLLP